MKACEFDDTLFWFAYEFITLSVYFMHVKLIKLIYLND